MTSGEQPAYTLIHVPSNYEFPKEETLRDQLENGKFLQSLLNFIYF